MNGMGVANGLLGGLRLKRYWLTGEGAVKIGWNTPGDFERCVREVSKATDASDHLDVKGYCANLHHAATGMWPGDSRNK